MLKHDTVAVYVIQHLIMPFIRSNVPNVAKIHYFSDGAASQYKNKKAFKNLTLHHSDFGVKAEWNFFATSHGKSPCDGIGGTVKFLARRASLQRPNADQILTSKQLYEFADGEIKNIKFIWMSTTDRENHEANQEARHCDAKTINGTREQHQFIPQLDGVLELRRISNDTICTTHTSGANNRQLSDTVLPGRYVASIYENHWYVGSVTQIGQSDFDEIEVSFMEVGDMPLSYRYPRKPDICWVARQDILSVLELTTQNHRTYIARAADLDRIHESFTLKVVKLIKQIVRK